MIRRRAAAGALSGILLLAAGAPARASDCSGTSVGAIPLADLGAGTYLGFQGGLYPGGAAVRPPAHAAAADTAARVQILDPSGVPDEAAGLAVFLSVGMSNTTQEFSRFIQIAGPLAGRNQAVRLVDGAQGGWSADRVVDPNQNATFWSTIDARLAAAGVTTAQVQAVWLKEADARPTDPFPQHAQTLRDQLRTIVQMIVDRYPNTRQIYLSSRTYAGYASTDLNPEMYAYESGFSVKWLIEEQIGGSPALNFDPSRGPVEAAWLSWGPYLWADGLTPRSDGLIWECADFTTTDGTHPSASGRGKVADMLLDSLAADAVARRWFVDCAPSDPGAFSRPPRALAVDLVETPGGRELRWEDLGPAAGPATVHDVLAGSLVGLRAARGFSGASCAGSGIPAAAELDPAVDPPPGDGVYYLVRGKNACGAGTWGEPSALPAPRAALDASSPCP